MSVLADYPFLNIMWSMFIFFAYEVDRGGGYQFFHRTDWLQNVAFLGPHGIALTFGVDGIAHRMMPRSAPLAQHAKAGVLALRAAGPGRGAARPARPEDEGGRRECEGIQEITRTKDCHEGIRAFLEKRAPQWPSSHHGGSSQP